MPKYTRSVFFRNYPEYSSAETHPLTTKISSKARMAIKIYWAHGVHADPDNVFKGLADALFKNDKFLDGAFESHYAQDGKGKVEVEIVLND